MFILSTYVKRMLFVASVLTIATLTSCKDDETKPTDTALPNVIVTTSATSSVLWNTVILKIEATDNTAVKKIELKVDDVSVGTATTSPFEFQWDTQKTSEGQHKITGTATDDVGNEKSVDLQVTVQNILLKAQVPANLLPIDGESENQDRGFIFLSDNQGKVIVAHEFHNNEPVELRAPNFNGNEFFVTQAQLINDGWNVQLVTNEKVSRGTWVLERLHEQSNGNESGGQAELVFNNMANGYAYNFFTNGFPGGLDPENPTASATLNVSPSKLLIIRTDLETDERTYALIPSIVTGDNDDIDLSLATNAMTVETKEPPTNFPYAVIGMVGLRAANNDTELYRDIARIHNTEEGTIVINYPGNAFPAYHSVTRMTNDSQISASNSSLKPFDLVPLNATIEAAYANNKLTVATTGTMDFYNVNISKTFGETGNQFWRFYADKSTTEIIVPEIPDMLSDLAFRDLSEGYISSIASDYAKIDGGYSGLLSFVKASKEGLRDLDANPITEVKSITNEAGWGSRQGSGKGSRSRK